jgi:hypothetical protein
MITYKNTAYETTEELRDIINSDLSGLAYPITIKHKMIGEGQLTFIKVPLEGDSLYATVDFSTGTKILALDAVLTNRLFSIPEDALEIILEAQTAFKEDFETRLQAKREAESIVRKAQEEAARLVSQQTIYDEAKRRCAELVTQTQTQIADLRRVSNEYMDDALRRTEEAIAQSLEDVQNTRTKFNALAAAQAKRDGISE